MYIHEIGRIDALPNGAAATGPMPRRLGGPLLRLHRRAVRMAARHEAVAGQERREMRLHGDRTDARAAAAVRDAERLVQVEVRDVGAELAGRREADERIQVRAVDVHLAAVRVHDLADAHDAGLEHAVRRRIRDHDRGEIVAMRFAPCASRSARSTLPSSSQATTTTCMPDHLRRRRIGAVRRRRDQADVAMRLAARSRDTPRSRAGPRTRPASPRSAAATPRRSRCTRTASRSSSRTSSR